MNRLTTPVLKFLSRFDFETFIKNGIFPNFSSDAKYNLRLYEADSKELQTTDTIYAYAVSQSWDMGVGQRYDSPFNIDGVKSAQVNQLLFSGIVTGIINKIIITTGKINLVKF